MRTKITLSQWKEIEASYREASQAIGKSEKLLRGLVFMHRGDENTVELLKKMLDNLDDASFNISPYQVHPQSEWTGGDPDDPKNHTIREPNIIGLGAGRFPPEQIEEANATCHGPCDWTFEKEKT